MTESYSYASNVIQLYCDLENSSIRLSEEINELLRKKYKIISVIAITDINLIGREGPYDLLYQIVYIYPI